MCGGKSGLRGGILRQSFGIRVGRMLRLQCDQVFPYLFEVGTLSASSVGICTVLGITSYVGKMKRYSIFSILRNSMSYQEDWQLVWRSPEPKKEYDVIIIGGGGHGLGAAYYLAKDHGITNVAVLEMGWIGGGNSGRNTMTIRSNYIRDVSVPFHDYSIELYKGLSKALNYNIMFSQRGMISFLQSAGATRDAMRRANTMHIYGADYQVLNLEEVKRIVPIFEKPAKCALACFWWRLSAPCGDGAA